MTTERNFKGSKNKIRFWVREGNEECRSHKPQLMIIFKACAKVTPSGIISFAFVIAVEEA